jgi:hypothetical protein
MSHTLGLRAYAGGAGREGEREEGEGKLTLGSDDRRQPSSGSHPGQRRWKRGRRSCCAGKENQNCTHDQSIEMVRHDGRWGCQGGAWWEVGVPGAGPKTHCTHDHQSRSNRESKTKTRRTCDQRQHQTNKYGST